MFSSLPNELVLRVLDTLASSDRKGCISLCLVSSWTRRIALPHLLHTTIITKKNCTAFTEGVINSQHASYVKRLWAEHVINDSIRSILTSCTSITDLVTSPYLIISFDNPPSFQFLTHLYITSFLPYCVNSIKRMFPQLTHFSGVIYSTDVYSLEFHKVLLRVYGAQLVMAVIRTHYPLDDDTLGQFREMRNEEEGMYIVMINPSRLQRDWRENGSGRDNVWERARRETRSLLGLGANDDS